MPFIGIIYMYYNQLLGLLGDVYVNKLILNKYSKSCMPYLEFSYVYGIFLFLLKSSWLSMLLVWGLYQSDSAIYIYLYVCVCVCVCIYIFRYIYIYTLISLFQFFPIKVLQNIEYSSWCYSAGPFYLPIFYIVVCIY